MMRAPHVQRNECPEYIKKSKPIQTKHMSSINDTAVISL